MADRNKIIIDTDIGDDIDDAFAIALAVNSPEIEVVGITTVFRNTKKRANICSALLSSLNTYNIPVYAGIDNPLVASIIARQNDYFDTNGEFIPCQYDKSMNNYSYHKENGIDYIIDEVNKYPGEITIVPIGPLTNLAVAIRKQPEIIEKIKEIVLMGGYYTKDIPEWNILCDPEAARIVFTSGINVKAVGLDVTLKCKLDVDHLERLKKFSSNGCRILCTMMEKWFNHYKFECPVLHDPLTIGTLINKELVNFEDKTILIALDDNNYGKTLVSNNTIKNKASKIKVAINVDNVKFLDLFESRIFNR